MLALSPHAPTPEDWKNLRETMASEAGFLAGNWIEPWRRYMLGEHNWREPFRYLTLRGDNNQLLGAIPLAEQRAGPFAVQSLAGYYLPYRGIPVATGAVDEFADKFADYMTKQNRNHVLRMAPVPSWDPACQSVLEALKQRGWQLRTKHNAYRQVIRLPDSFEAYANERKGSRWSTIGRRWRKMVRERNATVKSFDSETGDDWAPVIAEMGDVEQQSWLARGGGDTHFVKEHHQQYWASVLNCKANGPNARAWVLYWDNAPIAFNFNIDAGPCRYYVAGHYAEHASRYSPGSVLLRSMITDAIERGLEFIDMGGGDPGYKAFWGSRPQEKAVIECMAFPPSLAGRGLELAFTTTEAAQRIRTALQSFPRRRST